jgi:hypothetical protein
MGVYIYTVSTQTVPGITVNGEAVHFTNFAGKDSFWLNEPGNARLSRKISTADTRHYKKGSKPRVVAFGVDNTRDLKETLQTYGSVDVFGFVNYSHTTFHDTKLGTESMPKLGELKLVDSKVCFLPA